MAPAVKRRRRPGARSLLPALIVASLAGGILIAIFVIPELLGRKEEVLQGGSWEEGEGAAAGGAGVADWEAGKGTNPYLLDSRRVEWWWGPHWAPPRGGVVTKWEDVKHDGAEDASVAMERLEREVRARDGAASSSQQQQQQQQQGGAAEEGGGRRRGRNALLVDDLDGDLFPGPRDPGSGDDKALSSVAVAGSGSGGDVSVSNELAAGGDEEGGMERGGKEAGGQGAAGGEEDGGGGATGPFLPSRGEVLSKGWIRRVPAGAGADAGGEPYMHMPMVEDLGNGTVVAAWQSSSRREGFPDQHIRVSFGRVDGLVPEWAAPAVVVPVLEGEGPAWGPVLHWDEKSGKLWLFYSQSRVECSSPGGDVKVVTTADGVAWSRPRVVYSMEEDGWIGKVVANRLAVLRSGDWVLPMWRERASCTGPSHKVEHNSMGVLVSRDGGAVWAAQGRFVHRHTWMIEPSVVLVGGGGGRPCLFARTSAGHLFRLAADRWPAAPTSWTGPTSIETLPNADTKASMVRLSGQVRMRPHRGRPRFGAPLLAVNNFHSKGLCTRCRTHLHVAASSDEGHTWRRVLALEDVVRTGLRMHYPTVVELLSSPGAPEGCWRVLVVYSVFYMPGQRPAAGAGGEPEGIRCVVAELCP